LHQIAHVGVSPSRGLKLFGREIISEEFQPVWKIPQRHGQTDRQTIYDCNTSLCTKVHRAVKTSSPSMTVCRPLNKQNVPAPTRHGSTLVENIM